MTKWKIILKYLLLKIQNRDIIIGDILPSEGKLKIKFSCNRHTVSNAMKELKKKKMIHFVVGLGHILIKTYEEEISIRSFINFTRIESKTFDISKFPIKLLSNFDLSDIKKSSIFKFYLDDINIAIQYIFFKNINVTNFYINNLFEQLSYNGIVVQDIKKEIYFIDNKNGILDIQDTTIIAIKISLFDDNGIEIMKVYNLISQKYFVVYNKTLIIN